MAIFHLAAQVIKRSDGRSCVAAAAYRAAERLVDDRLGLVHNYTSKGGVEHTEIMAPKGAPSWARDRSRLWNAVERAESRRDAQLAREVRVALPHELTPKQQLKMVRRYIQEQFVGRGMIADLAIHRDNPENHHAHILLTMREIGPDGFGNKNRDWNRKEILQVWREEWEHSCNRALHRAGHAERVDHRSHIARGLLTIPGVKIGLRSLFAKKDNRGYIAERLSKHDAIVRLNGEAIRKDPTIALQELTYHEATFTRADVGVWLNSHTADAEQFKECMHAVMAHPSVTEVGRDGQQAEVFSTHDMLQAEKEMLGLADALEKTEEQHTSAPHTVTKVCETFNLTEEQTQAVRHLVQDTGRLALLEGLPGTGKSYMFRGAAMLWQKQGRRVLGMALSGKAAEGLHHGSKIKDCRSIAAWEYAWSQGKDAVRKGDVMVVDEAGMVGTRQMQRLLAHAHKAGAKVVLAGDTAQLQAVEAGSPLRAIGEMVAKVEMSAIRRQNDAWQRDASLQLARGQTQAAISAYAKAGCVHRDAKAPESVARIMGAWEAHERQAGMKSQVVLSYRRSDIAELNLAIRALRRHMGKLGGDYTVETENGTRKIAEGDRLCFTKNNKKMGVKNGTLAEIEKISGKDITVRLDGDEKKQVTFNVGDWKHFDLGYALTIHKSQGVTVDRTHVYASTAFDRYASCVALTRHKERLDIYYSDEEFGKTRGLAFMLGRDRRKNLALDFVKAERDNARLAAQEAARKSHEPAVEKPASPAAPSMVQASRAYADAEAIAKKKILTPVAVFHIMQETAPDRQHVRVAVEARDWWRQQVDAYQQNRPLSAKLGLRKPPIVTCPTDGQTMRLQEGLDAAEARLAAAAAKLEALRDVPTIWRKAVEHAEKHNAPILQAQAQLPALEKAFDEAKTAYTRAGFKPQERSLGYEKDRGLGR